MRLNRDMTYFLYYMDRASTLIVSAASQRGCMINTIDSIYSKLPPDDE